MNPLITIGGTMAALFLVAIVLVIVARATRWKPTPIRPVWCVVAIVAVDALAGLVCALVAGDFRVLGWWLLGLPLAVVGIPVVVVMTSLGVRLVNCAVASVWRRLRSMRP